MSNKFQPRPFEEIFRTTQDKTVEVGDPPGDPYAKLRAHREVTRRIVIPPGEGPPYVVIVDKEGGTE